MSKQHDDAHLLAIDIGNTNIVWGVHDGQRWVHTWRVQTVRQRMPDEYAVMFRNFLREADLNLDQFAHTVISSVVPSLKGGISQMVEARTGYPPVVVSHTINLGITIDVDYPESVGTDRIADAVAAYERIEGNCVVVDFGTATAFTIVREPGVLVGAVIAAGLGTTADALVGRTAQLPQVELAPPPSIIARNTIHAMQAGLVTGHLAMVEGIIARIRAELGPLQVIATGGLATVLQPYTHVFDLVDPWLTLDGLRLIAQRNPRQ